MCYNLPAAFRLAITVLIVAHNGVQSPTQAIAHQRVRRLQCSAVQCMTCLVNHDTVGWHTVRT